MQIALSLHRVDDDNDGQLDLEEFKEGMWSIDDRFTEKEIDRMFRECVWTEDGELDIELFCGLLHRRCQCPAEHSLSADSVVRSSFPGVFRKSNECLLSHFWNTADVGGLDTNRCSLSSVSVLSTATMRNRLESESIQFSAYTSDSGDDDESSSSSSSSFGVVPLSKGQSIGLQSHFAAELRRQRLEELREDQSMGTVRGHERTPSMVTAMDGVRAEPMDNEALLTLKGSVHGLAADGTASRFRSDSVGSSSTITPSAMTMAVRIGKWPPTVIKEVEQILDLCDQDGDGLVSKSDVLLFLAELQRLKSLNVSEGDVDADGGDTSWVWDDGRCSEDSGIESDCGSSRISICPSEPIMVRAGSMSAVTAGTTIYHDDVGSADDDGGNGHFPFLCHLTGSSQSFMTIPF